jgi:hypothetical protein
MKTQKEKDIPGYTSRGAKLLQNVMKGVKKRNPKGPIFVNQPVIQALKHLTYSKRDMYGNCYGFITVTNTKTGESIESLIDSIGNENYILNKMNIKYVSSETMLPIREYNRLAKGLPCDYIPMLFKLFKKNYKAYLTEKEADRVARDKYYSKLRKKQERQWKSN